MDKTDLKQAKIEAGGLRRLITRMLNNDSLDQLPLFGVEGTAKRQKIRNHNATLKRAWREMRMAKGLYRPNTEHALPPKLIYDSNQGPAARSSNVTTGDVSYIPWKEIAR